MYKLTPKVFLLFHLSCLAFCLATTVVSCGDNAKRACNNDGDCPGSQVCTANLCQEVVPLGDVFKDSGQDSTDVVDMSPDDTSSDVPDRDGPGIDVLPPGEYRFVRIDDLTLGDDSKDKGADIDAVILEKPNGTLFFGIGVEYFDHGGGVGDMKDPSEALGAPDAFFAYPALHVCDADDGFVSLGGTGGTMVLRLDAEIEPGDTLTVLEVGECEWDIGDGRAVADPLEVAISTGPSSATDWLVLGPGEGPAVSFVIPQAP